MRLCETRDRLRFFNTAGPVVPARHYCLPPLARPEVEEFDELIHQQKYFVLHAPRQTGKTSTLLALRDRLNAGNRFRCVYVNVEPAQAAREDVEQAMRSILSVLADAERQPDTWSSSTGGKAEAGSRRSGAKKRRR